MTAHSALPPRSGESPTPEQVTEAIQKVKEDPNLSTVRKERTLKWVDNGQENHPAEPTSAGQWIGELFSWIATSARVLLWVAAAIFTGLLVVYLVRIVRVGGTPHKRERFVAPSHVRDLDIRPESLPADIGAAARTLWDAGEHRSALALLYRGLLSRLVHVHGVPIRDSSTEGDCLALSAGSLSQTRSAFVSRLVGVWQHAVYGREEIDTTVVHAICDGFATALDAQPPTLERSGSDSLVQST
jgi:hypothetical protein